MVKKTRPQKKTGTRSDSQATRAKIIASALSLYKKHGVHPVTFAQIARHAKIPQPLLLYHFKKSEDLLLQVINEVLLQLKSQSIQAIEAHSKDPVKALLAYTSAPFLWAQKSPGHFNVWLYFYYLASIPGVFRDLNDSIRVAGRDRISQLLYEAAARKQISRVTVDEIPALALAIQNAITGAVILAGTESRATFKQVQTETYRAIQKLLQI